MLLFSAQVARANGQGDARIDFKGYEVSNERVNFNYEIPFGGMVELRLYGADGELVWRNQYINKRGQNRITLKTKAFNAGETYTVEMKYKKDVFRKEFQITD